MLLEIENLTCNYGKVAALKDVGLTVDEGEIVALIGSNGAGKSTLLRTISGLIYPVSGQITFLGRRIDRLPPHKVVRLGIAHIPEGRLVFAPMTVHDNLKMGAYRRRDKKQINSDMERTFEYFPILEDRRRQLAGSLWGGEQQMLAVARPCVMTSPRLVLMDEPSMGLSPLLVEKVADIVVNMQRDGLSVLLVEQNAALALSVANRAYVLEIGRVVAEGDARAIGTDEALKKAYLGE
jgi:branched-chain amino acid transport system ATP-binding protein